MGRFAKFALLMSAGVSLIILLIARPAGDFLGSKLASAILNLGKGKISNPSMFISGRLTEAAWLLALAVLLTLIYLTIRRRVDGRSRAWIPLSVVSFAAFNIWLLTAMNTCVFWAALYTGTATSNITQFHFKKLLIKENPAPRRVLLVGSSQTRAQLDENILNQQLKNQAWVTELHFPGSHGLDLLLVLRRLRGQPGDDLVCYLSEYYFYSGLYSTTVPYFLSAADIPLLRNLGWGPQLRTQAFALGFLGEALPLFACREPLSDRLFGVSFNSTSQAAHDSALETNLAQRAESSAKIFKLDGQAALQKVAFEEFVREAARQKRRLILFEGQVNPLLAKRIPPFIRSDMKQFLRRIAHDYSHVRLVPEEELPAQADTAYEDLTHVSDESQRQFSIWFSGYLERQNQDKAVDLRGVP